MRSWVFAGLTMVVGLGLYVYDDWAERVEVPILKDALNYLEIVFMGPVPAALAFMISESLRAREERYRQGLDQERERRFRFLGRIAASMAHEIRNPLHNLHLLSDELGPRLDGAERELVASIKGNLARLDQATQLIYQLVKPQRGGDGESGGPVDLVPLVAEVVAEAQRDAERQAAISQLAPGLPVIASAQREGVRIMLQNLVRNAVEAAEGGAVEIGFAAEEALAVVTIRNAGTMPPAFMAEEDEGVSHKPGGLGVGIAIARHLAASSGGAVRFACADGWVTTRLELPRGG